MLIPRYLFLVVLVCCCSVPADAAGVWNVASPPTSAEPQTVAIDVDRGTWMNLDVSPDGQWITFDLLGDIYVLPIGGGRARNIADGHQWDIQPRFSPDGEFIAFTSDRGGAENIWVMRADGSELRQLTRETFRLPNNPTWSPDGRYIAVKKHYTTQRSIGTGEIWLYALDGGDGIPVVERPTPAFQKELGEPAFAPDGSAIYFTQNVTPGDTFRYAQDVNREVFRIRKVDLDSGRVSDIAGGPGGAVRPVPSPDGRRLAFVRRAAGASRLFVRELATGDERMLVPDIDQDLQETWAVRGLYPNMAWMPDSASIVFAAHGRINRVDLETGEVVNVPFRVTDERTVYPPPDRPTVDVSPETFRTRIPRWPRARNGAVVYESLGRLWRVPLVGSGEPSRLTRDDDLGFELFPVPERAGRWTYFVAWDDVALGSIHRVPTGGGRSEPVSVTPGHYRELAVSPDGEMLVVRVGGSGDLLSPRYSGFEGIYVMPAAGGAMQRIAREGIRPHFGGSKDRVYFSRRTGDDVESRLDLVGVNLDGLDERTLARSAYATEFRVSPDDRHVAFRENYHIYVAPLPRVGSIVELGTEVGAVPVARLTQNGGNYPGWLDETTVSWVTGSRFALADIGGVFRAQSRPVPVDADLSIQADSDRPAAGFAIVNARIVTMGDAGVIERGTIVVEGNRIATIGGDGIPDGVPVLDAEGMTVLPGFIDSHAHIEFAEDGVVPEQNWKALAHLAFGVTTVLDPANTAVEVFPAAEYRRAGLVPGPRIYSTGDVIYGARSPQWARIDGLDDALGHVRRLKAQGALAVKNYNQPRREQRQQIVEAARLEGMPVIAEGGAQFQLDMTLIVDGNTSIEHTLPPLGIQEDVVQLWSGTRVEHTPTILLGFGTINAEDYWYQATDVWTHPLLSRWVPPRLLRARSIRRQMAPDSEYRQKVKVGDVRRLQAAGVRVHYGAHGQREGLGTHWALWTLVQGGLSEIDALRAATISPARYLGLDRDLGSIEPGKIADLVVIDGNPLVNIRESEHVRYVVINGRLHDSTTLEECLTGDGAVAPLYWYGRPESELR